MQHTIAMSLMIRRERASMIGQAAKKAWCCLHAARGCPDEVSAALGVPAPTTSIWDACDLDLDDWQHKWSQGKKDWCCRHGHRGCTSTPEPKVLCFSWRVGSGCIGGEKWRKLSDYLGEDRCHALCERQAAALGQFCCWVRKDFGCYAKPRATYSSWNESGRHSAICSPSLHNLTEVKALQNYPSEWYTLRRPAGHVLASSVAALCFGFVVANAAFRRCWHLGAGGYSRLDLQPESSILVQSQQGTVWTMSPSPSRHAYGSRQAVQPSSLDEIESGAL